MLSKDEGQRTVDEEQNYPKWNSFASKHVKQSQKEHKYRRKSFPARVRAENDDEFEEEASGGSGMYELVFPGFLAIGTLGSDPSATPTSAISVEIENITEKEDEVTENELKLINDELEKVLGKEDGRRNNSKSIDSYVGRNSHVSSSIGTAGRRSSSTSNSTHGSSSSSSIMSSLTDHQSNGSAICPLQGYLFGSAIELSETKTAVAKKLEQGQGQGHGHQTSLGELFQSEKEKELAQADKSGISAMYLMKKKLKKGLLHASSRSSTLSTTAGPPVDSASASAAERKLHKILHMFHRKVHPEISTTAHNDSGKYQKKENKRKTINDVRGHNPPAEEDKNSIIMEMHPKRVLLAKENMRRFKCKSQSNPLQFPIGSDQDSYENNKEEHWIKTDADYLVLEL